MNFKLEAIKAQLKRTVTLKFGTTGVNVSGDKGNSNCSVPLPHVKHYSDQWRMTEPQKNKCWSLFIYNLRWATLFRHQEICGAVQCIYFHCNHGQKLAQCSSSPPLSCLPCRPCGLYLELLTVTLAWHSNPEPSTKFISWSTFPYSFWTRKKACHEFLLGHCK